MMVLHFYVPDNLQIHHLGISTTELNYFRIFYFGMDLKFICIKTHISIH